MADSEPCRISSIRFQGILSDFSESGDRHEIPSESIRSTVPLVG